MRITKSRIDPQDELQLSPARPNGAADDEGSAAQRPNSPFLTITEEARENPLCAADVVPPPHPKSHTLLPRSSGDLWLSFSELDGLLSSYSTLRSFSFILRLSPFTLKELCRDFSSKNPSTSLLDEIHLSLLRTLQFFPPMADEGEGIAFQREDAIYVIKESISHLINDPSWRFLDALTWPEFLRRWFLAVGTSMNLDAGDFFNNGDYWQLPTMCKINLLKSLCDDLLDSWVVRNELQSREKCIDYHQDSEGQEVAMKRKVAKGLRNDAAEAGIPEQFDHLYKRQGLDDLELDVCDVTGVGGTLMCCDGCPASYLGRSVGVKRVVDDNQAWFCEECRIGGQMRSHRYLHRVPHALEWRDQPSVADLGHGFGGLRCFSAYGRVFVGSGKEMYAYYSTVEQIDNLITFFETVRNDSSEDTTMQDTNDFFEASDGPDVADEEENQGGRKRPRYAEYSSDDNDSGQNELPFDAAFVLKKKKKALYEQMAFRAIVEAKQLNAKEYVNKYKDAQSLAEVWSLINKTKDKQERKKGDASSLRKWNGWPRSNDSYGLGKPGLVSVSLYLQQLERTLLGLVDGHFVNYTGRREWIEMVEQADDVSELAKAALTLEANVRSVALSRGWFAGGDKRAQSKGRPKGRKDGKKEQEVDWNELREAGIFEDLQLQGPAAEEEDDIPHYLVWASGRQVVPLGINLSRKSLRDVILSAGEAEVASMTYKGITAAPSARLVWIRAMHEAKSPSQLALQLRVLDEAVRPDITRKPVPPADLTNCNVVERVVGKREAGRGHTEYQVQLFGQETRTEWMQEDSGVPLYCIREYEQDVRRTSESERKKIWWKDFDFHPGAALEIDSEGQWYEGYVVQSVDKKPSNVRECGGLQWREGVGIVRVHYIGGLDEEDEWLYKDDERLREDPKTEARMLKDRARRIREELKANRIPDKELRMQARLELYQERLMLREKEAHLRSARDCDKARDKERKEQEKLERIRQREREKLGKMRERESRETERENRILERRMEQERKKEEAKLMKKAAKEKQRVEQGKKGWWKDFNWSVGIMVEMEWQNEWWEAVIVKVVPPTVPAANSVQPRNSTENCSRQEHVSDETLLHDGTMPDVFHEGSDMEPSASLTAVDAACANSLHRPEPTAGEDGLGLDEGKVAFDEKELRMVEGLSKVAEVAAMEDARGAEKDMNHNCAGEDRKDDEAISISQHFDACGNSAATSSSNGSEISNAAHAAILGDIQLPAATACVQDGALCVSEFLDNGVPGGAGHDGLEASTVTQSENGTQHIAVEEVARDGGHDVHMEASTVTQSGENGTQHMAVEDMARGGGCFQTTDVEAGEVGTADVVVAQEMDTAGVDAGEMRIADVEAGEVNSMDSHQYHALSVDPGADVQAAATSDVGADAVVAEESKNDDMESWEAALAYMVSRCQGPSIIYPDDWPEDGKFVCEEDDRPIDIARRHRVNVDRLVSCNKKTYHGLTKTSLLKAGTVLDLPLPMDIQVGDSPPPPPDPWGVGVVLIHYVGGDADETEWIFRCSKRIRPSNEKTWNCTAVEAVGDDHHHHHSMTLGGGGGGGGGDGDPQAWRRHCAKVLKRVRKCDKSWPFWEPVDPIKEGVEDYFDFIEKPMCLDQVEANLTGDRYGTPGDFAEDMRLIFNNAMRYNPPEHSYHQLAQKTLTVFEEAWAAGKAENNWGQPPAGGVSLARESLGAAGSTPAGAKRKQKRSSVGKDGVQDSAKKADRVKAEHVKGEKGGQKGKGEAGEGEREAKDEVGDGQETGEEKGEVKIVPFVKQRLTKSARVHVKGLVDTLKMHELARPFLEPVVEADVPDYYAIVKKPMDFGTLSELLNARKCNTPAHFERCVRLIFHNARLYNGDDDPIAKAAKALERMFERKWAKILERMEHERSAAAGGGEGGGEQVAAESPEAAQVGATGSPPKGKGDAAAGNGGGGRKRVRQSAGGEEEVAACDGDIAPAGKKRKSDGDKKRHLEAGGGGTSQGETPLKAGKKTPQGKAAAAAAAAAGDGGAGEQYATPQGKVISDKSVAAQGSQKKGKGSEQTEDVVNQCLALLDALVSARGGQLFAEPVDAIALGLTDYQSIVTEPMDLGTVREKLLSGAYSARRKGQAAWGPAGVMEGFSRDVRQTFGNAMLYNPESDRVYKAAVLLADLFETRWAAMGGEARRETAASAAAAQAQVGNHVAAAEAGGKSKRKSDSEPLSTPKVTPTPPPAAAGGRGTKRSQWLVRCLAEVERLKQMPEAVYFLEPVDAKALGLRDYHRIVKRPMDLGTVEAGLEDGSVASEEQFNELVDLVFDNAMLYNPENDLVHVAARRISLTRRRAPDHGPAAAAEAVAAPSHRKSDSAVKGASKHKADQDADMDIGSPAVARKQTPGAADQGESKKRDKAVESPAGLRKQATTTPLAGKAENRKAEADVESPAVSRKQAPASAGKGENRKADKERESPAAPASRKHPPTSADKSEGKRAEKEGQSPALPRKDKSDKAKVGEHEPERAGRDATEEEPGAEIHAVGTRVRMLFSDGVWYEGHIERYAPRSKEYTIAFPDGDVQRVRLPDPEVVVCNNGTPQTPAAAGGKGRPAAAGRAHASPAPDTASAARPAHAGREEVVPGPILGKSKSNKDGRAAVSRAAVSPAAGAAGGGGKEASATPPAKAASEAGSGGKRGTNSSQKAGKTDEAVEEAVGQCMALLDSLLSARGGHLFAEPVNAVALGLTDYHSIVTEPMDLGTVREKLLSGAYSAARRKGGGHAASGGAAGVMEGFSRDVRQTLDNAMLYNPESDRVYKAALSLRQLFDAKWGGGGGGGESAAAADAAAAAAAAAAGGKGSRQSHR